MNSQNKQRVLGQSESWEWVQYIVLASRKTESFCIRYFWRTKRKSTETITECCFPCQNKSVCQKLPRSCKKWKSAKIRYMPFLHEALQLLNTNDFSATCIWYLGRKFWCPVFFGCKISGLMYFFFWGGGHNMNLCETPSPSCIPQVPPSAIPCHPWLWSDSDRSYLKTHAYLAYGIELSWCFIFYLYCSHIILLINLNYNSLINGTLL